MTYQSQPTYWIEHDGYQYGEFWSAEHATNFANKNGLGAALQDGTARILGLRLGELSETAD